MDDDNFRSAYEIAQAVLADLGCASHVDGNVISLAQWKRAHARASTKTSVVTESQAVALDEGDHDPASNFAMSHVHHAQKNVIAALNANTQI